MHFRDASPPLGPLKAPTNSRVAKRPRRCGRGRYVDFGLASVIALSRHEFAKFFRTDAHGGVSTSMGAAAGVSSVIFALFAFSCADLALEHSSKIIWRFFLLDAYPRLLARAEPSVEPSRRLI